MDIMLWNIVLTFISGLVLWFIKMQWDEISRVQILLNRTREEVARDHITRSEFRADMQQLLDRFDRLERKIDAMRNANAEHQ